MNNENVNNGVLSLPSNDYPKELQTGGPHIRLASQLNAASKVARKGVFHTNAPPSYKDEFDRYKYYDYSIESSFHQDISFTIPLYKPGAYNYYISYEDENGCDKETEKFYYNVPPHLAIDGKYVPFNAINVETVISKWIDCTIAGQKFLKNKKQRNIT